MTFIPFSFLIYWLDWLVGEQVEVDKFRHSLDLIHKFLIVALVRLSLHSKIFDIFKNFQTMCHNVVPIFVPVKIVRIEF